MTRLLPALLLPVLVAAAPARDWSAVTTRLPGGTFLIGNPAARVKLVEYASYTCPHCAAFSAESEAVLTKRLIRSGGVSLEIRHLIRDKADLAAAVVARCTGAAGFAATTRRLFAEQRDWLPRAAAFGQTNAARLRMYPPLAQLRALADGGGISAIGRAQGLTDQRLDACFADQAEIDRVVAITAAVPAGIAGTPAFFINGKPVPGASWAALAPALGATAAR